MAPIIDKITRKRFPIMAGMEFTYRNGEVKNVKMRKVGYYIVEFTFAPFDDLIGERVVKKVFY